MKLTTDVRHEVYRALRGFYREQPYGPKHSLRREKWIEPFMRGGDEEG